MSYILCSCVLAGINTVVVPVAELMEQAECNLNETTAIVYKITLFTHVYIYNLILY